MSTPEKLILFELIALLVDKGILTPEELFPRLIELEKDAQLQRTLGPMSVRWALTRFLKFNLHSPEVLFPRDLQLMSYTCSQTTH